MVLVRDAAPSLVFCCLWTRFTLRCGGYSGKKQQAPDFTGVLPSVSYAPFEGTGHPDVDNIPSIEKIRADMKTLAPLTRAIRLLFLDRRRRTGAADRGRVRTEGHRRRVDRQECRSQRARDRFRDSISRNATATSSASSSANETIYRGEQKVDDLIELIKRVKKIGQCPGHDRRIWNIWRDNPQLGYSVDFIAAHVLPYWENFTAARRSTRRFRMYQLLRDPVPRQGGS